MGSYVLIDLYIELYCNAKDIKVKFCMNLEVLLLAGWYVRYMVIWAFIILFRPYQNSFVDDSFFQKNKLNGYEKNKIVTFLKAKKKYLVSILVKITKSSRQKSENDKQ